jgi:hypothetical protein
MIERYPGTIITRDEWRRYPVHYFSQNHRSYCGKNDYEIVRLLGRKSKGVVLNSNKYDVTPFAYAFENLSLAALKYLYFVEPASSFGNKIRIVSLLKEGYIKK